MLDYLLGTLGTVSKAYENNELQKEAFCLGHFVFNLYEGNIDKIVPRAYEGPSLVLVTVAYIHYRTLSWIGTGILIKGGGDTVDVLFL